jgi:four helix bundle suffix protein
MKIFCGSAGCGNGRRTMARHERCAVAGPIGRIRRIGLIILRGSGTLDPAVVANALICLIHQANYLLDQQIARSSATSSSAVATTERLAAARIEERKKNPVLTRSDPSDRSDSPAVRFAATDGDAHRALRRAPRLCSSAARATPNVREPDRSASVPIRPIVQNTADPAHTR